MVNISRAFFYLILGLLTGITIVSMMRNGEINWTVIGYTTVTAIVAFFVISGTHLVRNIKTR